MALLVGCCGHWQHAAGQDRKHHDVHEIGFSDSEASGAMSTETPEPESEESGPQESESSFTPRTHDSIDSLFFPDLHCCVLPAAAEARWNQGSPPELGEEEVREIGDRQPQMLEERDLTQSFKLEVGHMPPVEVPNDLPHLVIKDQHLQDLLLDQLEGALLEDSILEQYLQEGSKSYDISLSFWGTTAGGIHVRRAWFTMPVPQDLPPALARLVAVPQISRATLLLGFTKPSDDELLVWLQQFTHDVPYGENFRVQETMRFRIHPQGGLTFNKWTMVKWVKALPWMMAPMKPITESKTATGAIAAADAFLDAVRTSAQQQVR